MFFKICTNFSRSTVIYGPYIIHTIFVQYLKNLISDMFIALVSVNKNKSVIPHGVRIRWFVLYLFFHEVLKFLDTYCMNCFFL